MVVMRSEQLAVSEGYEVGRGSLELEAAHAGADVYVGELCDGGLVVGGEGFLHADGGAAAADVAGQGKEFLDVDQFGALVAGDAGGFLEVDLAVAPDHADEMAVAVAAQDDGLVDAGDVLSELGGYGIGGEVLLLPLVWDQFVRDFGAVGPSGRLGLFGGFVLTLGSVFFVLQI